MTISTFYSATITNPGGLSAPSDGFLDPWTIPQWEEYGSASPTLLTQGEAKARGNLRYKAMVLQLGVMCNSYVSNWQVPGASATSEPTSITFTIESEFGDECVTTPDELNPGQFLTLGAAYQRCIARALIQDMFHLVPVCDPTIEVTLGPNPPSARNPYITENLEVGAIASTLAAAAALITVTRDNNITTYGATFPAVPY